MVKRDPWLELPTETVEVGGVKVEVRGLTYDEVTSLAKEYEKDNRAFSRALICKCCTRSDGIEITPDILGKFRANIISELDAAVARVNSPPAGNSKATGADNLSSA